MVQLPFAGRKGARASFQRRRARGRRALDFSFRRRAARFAHALPGFAFLGALLWGWISTYRRLQALEDIPLARIGTAAQGYARLQGRAALFPGSSLRSPVTGQPCCWYSYSVTTYDEQGEVQSSETDTTEWSFMMTDGSGECVIDPVGARVIAARVNSYRDKQQAWTEEIIVAHEPLAVVGEFTASGASVSEAQIEARTGALLARDLRIWAWIYVVGFVAGAAALGWLLLRRW